MNVADRDRRYDAAAFAASAVLGAGALALIVLGRAPSAGIALVFTGCFLLGFVRPQRAWAWTTTVWLLASIGGAIDVVRMGGQSGTEWCPHVGAPITPWQVAGVLLVIAAIGAVGGWLCDAILTFVIAKLEPLKIGVTRYLKIALRSLAVAVAFAGVCLVALAAIEPLQPYGPHDPYCWDEFCFEVTAVQRAPAVGTAAHRVLANGEFYVVSANLEAPWWGRFVWSDKAVFVLDRDGNEYEYSRAAQQAIGGSAQARAACHEILGAAERETIAFDLPKDVVQPRLLIRDTLGIEGIMGRLRGPLMPGPPAFNLRFDP